MNWHNVSKKEPCPVCHHDSWCTVSDDGGMCVCRRVESDRPAKSGIGWIHSLREVKVKGEGEQWKIRVPYCKCGGVYKPDITFFGESLPEEAFAASQSLAIRSDVFLVLGTSLTVFPAAGLPRLTLQAGGKVFIVNAQPTSLDEYAAGVYRDLSEFADAALKIL